MYLKDLRSTVKGEMDVFVTTKKDLRRGLRHGLYISGETTDRDISFT